MVVVAHAHGGTVHGEKMSEVLWVGSECWQGAVLIET